MNPSPVGLISATTMARITRPTASRESRAGAIQCFLTSSTMDSLGIRFSLTLMSLPGLGAGPRVTPRVTRPVRRIAGPGGRVKERARRPSLRTGAASAAGSAPAVAAGDPDLGHRQREEYEE